VNAWDVFETDLGWGLHPVVIVSHPARAARKEIIEVLDCTSQRAVRAPNPNEVVLDKSDGMDWPTLCKCDCLYAVPRESLKNRRGNVALERRRQIVRAMIESHGWNAL
jgi:hypothetical protein